MEPQWIDPGPRRELHQDVHAAVAARNELGPEMEDHVLDAFLARLEQRVVEVTGPHEARTVQQKSARNGGAGGGGTRRKYRSPAEVVAPSLALAIPLLAIAGNIAHSFGIFMVMAGVVLINVLYFIDRWIME